MASRLAVDLARKYGSELLFLNVIPAARYSSHLVPTSIPPPPGLYEQERKYEHKLAEAIVNRAVRSTDGSGLEVRTRIQESIGSVVEAIAEYSQGEKVDLIVIGTRGLSGFKKLLIGSVSSGVVSHAHCPVLVVR